MVEVLIGIVAATALITLAGLVADKLPSRIMDKLMEVFKA